MAAERNTVQPDYIFTNEFFVLNYILIIFLNNFFFLLIYSSFNIMPVAEKTLCFWLHVLAFLILLFLVNMLTEKAMASLRAWLIKRGRISTDCPEIRDVTTKFWTTVLDVFLLIGDIMDAMGLLEEDREIREDRERRMTCDKDVDNRNCNRTKACDIDENCEDVCNDDDDFKDDYCSNDNYACDNDDSYDYEDDSDE